jgi:hypothetical protein
MLTHAGKSLEFEEGTGPGGASSPKTVVGDPAKLRGAIGDYVQVPLDQALTDVLAQAGG